MKVEPLMEEDKRACYRIMQDYDYNKRHSIGDWMTGLYTLTLAKYFNPTKYALGQEVLGYLNKKH